MQFRDVASCPPQAVEVQGPTKSKSPGLVNFVTALAYLFCLALPAAFMQPGYHLLAEPCACIRLRCDAVDVDGFIWLGICSSDMTSLDSHCSQRHRMVGLDT